MANAEGQAENLRPPTHEEAKERGRKGGVSSGRSRKRRKAFRELVDAALRGRGAKGRTLAEDVVLALIEKALEGNVKAFEVLRDTVGEKPSDRHEISGPGDGPCVVVFDGGRREPV
ncbi:MAG: hypothetical protein J5863_08460 [Desulfovibrio sp.]|nr:hypothetical protein [Desulfovibrio sp.]